MKAHSLRRFLHAILAQMSQKNFRHKFMISLGVYSVISIIYIYRVALYGEEDSFNSFFKPLFILIPSSLSSGTNTKILTYPTNPTEAAELYEKLRYDTSGKWIDEYYLKSHLLTVKIGPNKGKILNSVDDLEFYNSDPRLVWSVYLNDVTNNGISDDYNMPFSWYDFADFTMYNKLISIKEKHSDTIQCSILLHPSFDKANLGRWEKEIGEELFHSERFKYDDPFWYRSSKSFSNTAVNSPENHCQQLSANNTRFNLPLNITNYMERVRPEVFDLQARNYLLNTIDNPLSITLLNSDDDAYRIDVKQGNRANMVESRILHKYIDQQPRDKIRNDIIFDHDVMFSNFISSDASQKFKVEIPGLNRNVYDEDSVNLELDDFKFDAKTKIAELEEKGISNLSIHDKNYLESLKVSISTHPSMASKYFREPGGIIQFKAMGHHRDQRFFHGALIYDQVEYSARLNSMIRTFQKFIKANGLISWLSHGTLYGQLYNGLAFPWDNDFDLQMPLKHLNYMAQYFNQSIIMEDPREGNGRFLLDVGTSITVRRHGNGNNNIDARFVDIDSGLYIDITALAVTADVIPINKFDYYDMNKAKEIKWSDDVQKLTKEMEDKYYDAYTGLAKLSIEKLRDYVAEHQRQFDSTSVDHIVKMYNDEVKKLPIADTISKNLTEVQRYIFNEKLTMINCRNHHFNTLEMLSPLKLSMFHGVPVFLPHKVISSMKIEYTVPPKYGYNSYEKHTFTAKLNHWVPSAIMNIVRNVVNDNALFKIHSNLMTFRFNDMLSLFKNMLIAREYDTFTVIHNAFDTVTYRQKEIEIEYDNRMSIEDKKKYLNQLRTKFAKNMDSPAKDPALLQYEQSLWDNYEKYSDVVETDSLVSMVNDKVLKRRWKDYSMLYERNYFKVDEQYLDNIGLELFENSQEEGKEIFLKDPLLE
ncbi:similar to Saccharomyces cerevisiae YKL201C MNN4 Putative positive regulator of mannosylphosphate transferase (Mnn6p), involved in mannosylphosphorylation of N-linked oligosaccharides [Maudiozyma saulgeensis]|uniref:Similar to Saccharomyces cerevisiae YKL201C MNN4 Putative positive regulator of mannosylphosphate transferase (Mnn6p), involved in mannosylphosphorylation of N-linked oligosaccharides n=1 Tax=Maudiozyma saulgeensis TaxID=1789683 RepID=A0A1X7R1A0_9SACH|nr:similar to Saccharomyces cerevisiae YKL201C MNN4 Putative positive regulator of mannosylphosphate transferase (Mnn6p), involved in mannosylphosphorylation of N-linked oligosaccharides [Kazachstania saulgeensis]